ncbi:OmpA family protein [Flavobacterium silvaticum]|uniref:OmpA family protein n=1 Tax=Flavobacterium silvaticum TaxID=1852020 RepID=A0A972JG34_9FLAO|nr:OmpA family protein [Flavobacterium silvaticum]NMH27791.1 OmpA family protein [Flavobacterium silvaticum]
MKHYLILFLLTFLNCQIWAQQQFPLYFETNKPTLNKAETDKLQSWIKANSQVKIVAINGFTDEDGTSLHNDTLAKKRVDHIFGLVNGKIKLREDFKTRSFGEKHVQSPNKAENRKAVIFYITPDQFAYEDEILGIVPPKPRERVVTYPERLTVENPDGSKSEYRLNIDFMKEVATAKTGDKLTLTNLNFLINTFAIAPPSRGKLFELLLVMQKNPDLKIDIQGHLCCSTNDRLDLSTKRAKAVYQFLIANDIDKSRLSYRGFGVSQPKFAIPEQNEDERAGNRRVEIMIMAN